LEQAWRLRGRITELKTEFDSVELGRRPREQEISVAHGVQSAGSAERTADLLSADGFADVVDHDQRGAGGLTQTQQALT
jgi:hypothetical protein